MNIFIFYFHCHCYKFLLCIIKWYKTKINSHSEDREGLKSIVKYYFIYLSILVSIPIFLFSFLFLSVWFLEVVQQGLINSKYNLSIVDSLYLVGASSNYNEIIQGFVPPSLLVIVNYNFIVEITVSCGIAIFLVYTIVTTFLKHFELLCLYIISPFICISLSLKEFRAIYFWRMGLISKIIFLYSDYSF